MSWRTDEVWLDTEIDWFRDRRSLRPFAALELAIAAEAVQTAPWLPVRTGLEASRRRRLAAQAARRRRLATRTVPAVALVVGSATMLPIAALRHGARGQDALPLPEDPPSLTFTLDGLRYDPLAALEREQAARQAKARPEPKPNDFAAVQWRHATSVGLPYAGSLLGGTQLPVDGPDWVSWNPITDSVPNLPYRLFGNERTIRTIITVVQAYRAAHPHAPRVVIGDISRRDGGRMNEHVSHQNGLDVDVYYPRLDRHLRAPTSTGQIDRRLAQDLLDRFVAAGAQMVFVGFSTGLRGPSGVVIPYPNHENHMHVRFPRPG